MSEEEDARLPPERCGTCHWWRCLGGRLLAHDEGEDDRETLGWCHRNPPVPDPDDEDGLPRGYWPATAAGEWCGAWRQRQEGHP